MCGHQNENTQRREVNRLGVAVVIPAGTEHNVINTTDTGVLRLYTVYSPPEHPDGTVHQTKQEAEVYEREYHG